LFLDWRCALFPVIVRGKKEGKRESEKREKGGGGGGWARDESARSVGEWVRGRREDKEEKGKEVACGAHHPPRGEKMR